MGLRLKAARKKNVGQESRLQGTRHRPDRSILQIDFPRGIACSINDEGTLKNNYRVVMVNSSAATVPVRAIIF